jgi:hypothetical protein
VRKYPSKLGGEKIFRQIKQNSARVVNPTRRDFVKYDGKDSAEISCDEFLEVPFRIENTARLCGRAVFSRFGA